MRRVTDMCEVCYQAHPIVGIGFPAWPGAVPGLPESLRGMCLWVCRARPCDLAAQKRAAIAAAKAGVQIKTIWRHHPVMHTSPHPERTTQ